MLTDPNREKLSACGLTTETIGRAQLHSGSAAEVRDLLGYGVDGGGLIIPYDSDYSRVRIDNPGPDGKRYRSPKDGGNRLYVPAILDASVLADVSVPLYITEGEFKALKATQEGIPCVALAGVWSWKMRLHGKSFTIPSLNRVPWKGRKAIVVFDSDLADKPAVAWAEHGLVEELRGRGAEVYVLRLPDGLRGAKLGLDDYLVEHGVEAFRRLPMLTLTEADTGPPTFRRMTDLYDEYFLRVSAPHHRVHTGYPDLDRVLRGLAPGEVMTLLARPGVGKTSFALNLLAQMTKADALPTLLFSLEQQGAEIFERLGSMVTGIPGSELERRARDEDPEIAERLLEVCVEWEHLVVVEKPCVLEQIDRLIEEARRSEMWSGPLRVVGIDYLGLVGHAKPGSPYEQVSRAAREIKNFAKRHRVAVVMACQVDREGETGGEPISLKMARDSGVIEEAADYLLGLWRPELRANLTKEQRREVRGQFVVRVLKNRSGPAPRTVTLQFEPASLRITSSAIDAVSSEPVPF